MTKKDIKASPRPSPMEREKTHAGVMKKKGFCVLLLAIIYSLFTYSATVTNTNDSGPGSLRAAIAGATPGEVISFNITTGSPPYIISLLSALPDITVQVTIDGTTQPGYAGTPVVDVMGNAITEDGFTIKSTAAGTVIKGLFIKDFISTFNNGILVEAANVTISDNVIGNNDGSGIAINGGPGCTILNNKIGTDISGNNPYGNNIYGVTSQNDNTIIENNTISGNGQSGIIVFSMNNEIKGNKIGTNSSGTASLGNTGYGIYLLSGGGNNQIGGSLPGEGNIISGNVDGIDVLTNFNTIKGNKIGTDITGTFALGNTNLGIFVATNNNTIGGSSSAGEGNLISGNGNYGMIIQGFFNQIKGNKIGTDISGTISVPNIAGIGGNSVNCHDNFIGGVTPEEENLISGNTSNGIALSINSYSNRVYGNKIGVSSTGSSLPNNLGILIQGSNLNFIGGSAPGQANTIANNGAKGIDIDASGGIANSNLISHNLIYNQTKGIELHYATSQQGNNGQPKPVITSKVVGNGTGSVSGTAQANDIIELFMSDATGIDANPFLGTIIAVSGTWTINNLTLGANDKVVATATDANNNTSEFAADLGITIEISPNVTICAGTATQLSASGGTSYAWQPTTGLNNATISNPIASPLVTTTYTVTVSDAINSGTAQVTVTVNPGPTIVVTPPSATLCIGNSISLTAGGADTYTWAPSTGLNQSTGSSVIATPDNTTTYTTTGTDIQGCSNTAEVTVTVNPLPSVTVTPAAVTICTNGNFTSITLTASGAETYTWSPATFLNSSTGASVVSTPSAGIIYTVSGTDIHGCSNTATSSITVSYIPTVTVTPAAAVACKGGSVVLVAGGASSYTWLPASGLNATTGNIVTAGNLYNDISYTVTGINDEGCSTTAIATISINQTCCFANTVITGTVNYSNIPPQGDIKILVKANSQITLNGTSSFSSTDIIFESGVKVIVPDGGNMLLTDNSRLYTCNDEMWQGIEVVGTGTVTVNGSSSMEDAKIAITSNGGGNVFLDNAILNKNFVGVYVNNYNNSMIDRFRVKSSEFTCLSNPPTSPGSFLKFPYSGKHTYTGIGVYKIDAIAIGDSTSLAERNTFDNMDFGVQAVNSQIKIVNNEFTNIKFLNFPTKGAAIDARYTTRPGGNVSRTFYAGNVGAFTPNSISNCANGIIVTAYLAIMISKNTLSDIANTGIYLRANTARFGQGGINIKSNVLTNMLTGIWLYANWSENTLINVSDNQIDLSGNPDGRGIIVQRTFTTPYQQFYAIENNRLTDVKLGIWANVDDIFLTVFNNQIALKDVPANTFARGIYMQSHLSSSVVQNTVIGQSTSNVNVQGIRFDLSPNNTLTCNTTENVGVGLLFVGANTNTKVAKNIMKNNQAGLVLANGGIIGPQYTSTNRPYDNRWEGTFTFAHTYAFFSFGQNSPFKVRTNPSNNCAFPYYPCGANMLNLATVPTNSVSVSPTLGNLDDQICPFFDVPLMLSQQQENALRIINDSITYPVYDEGNRWWSNYHLYQALESDSLLLNSDERIRKFKNDCDDRNLGKLHEIEKSIGTESNNNILNQTKAKNNAINANNVIETNLKVVYHILLSQKSENRDTLNSFEIKQLQKLAWLCPVSDGPAVYTARVLLSQVDTIPVYYENECEQIVLESNFGKKEDAEFEEIIENSKEIAIYPNPAKDELNILLKLEEGETGQFEIYELRSSKAEQHQLTKNQTLISTKHLPAGIYLYKLIINDQLVETNKLVILK